jgi:hypothetical protein
MEKKMIRGASIVLALVMVAVLFAVPCVACAAATAQTSNPCCNHHSPCKTFRSTTAYLALAKDINPVQVPAPEQLTHCVSSSDGLSLAALHPSGLGGTLQTDAHLLTSQLNI